MKLTAYAVNPNPLKIRPAKFDREWMDSFPDKHAYRCLPMVIANCHGWELLCPERIELEWNGGPKCVDLTITSDHPTFAKSHFSRGIVTLHTDYIFQTEPGWNLLVTGPFNKPKHNLYPLTGIIESDWLPYTFTMNWKMGQGHALFVKDEPFCCVFPIPKNYLEDVELEIKQLEDNSELQQRNLDMIKSREASKEWNKHYFIGRHADGTKIEGHSNKLRLKEPVDLRQEVVYFEDWFDEKECKQLIEVFYSLEHLITKTDTVDSYWNGKYLSLAHIKAEYPDIFRMLDLVNISNIGFIKQRFKDDRKLYADLMHFVQWKIGDSMPPHQDQMDTVMHRVYSSIIYLNDDYEGGEIRFTKLNKTIKPKAGSIVFLRADECHTHEVLPVKSGKTRLTIPSFYTHDISKASRILHPELKK
jgi:hypothetical protein